MHKDSTSLNFNFSEIIKKNQLNFEDNNNNEEELIFEEIIEKMKKGN